MSQKTAVMFGLTIGSTIGSFIPVLFGGSELSYWSVLTGALGGIAGIYIAFMLSRDS
jgi:hypothetical protein